MESLLSILLAVVIVLLAVMFVLAWMVADLSRDVTTIAKFCGQCVERQIRQAESRNR